MKNRISLVVAFLCGSCLGLFSQNVMELKSGDFVDNSEYVMPKRQIEETENGVTVTYSFSHLMVDSVMQAGAYSIWIPQFGSCYKPGFPALPAKLDAIEVPSGFEPVLSIGDVSYEDYSMELTSTPELFTENGEPASLTEVNYSPGYLPVKSAIINNVQNYKGHNVCYVNVYPVRYNQTSKKLQIATSLTYTVQYKPSAMAFSIESEEEVEDSETLQDIIINPMERSEGVTPVYQVDVPRDYLIVSTSAFKPAISRFVEWKKALGFTVHEVYKDRWNSDSAVKDSIDRYYSMYPHIDYLLIVGNHDQVPAMKVANFNEHVTDLYYGSREHVFQYLPDKYRGRIPVESVEEAENALEKIIAYEVCENIPCDDFFSTSLHCAMFESSKYYPASYGIENTRFIQTSEEIINTVIREGIVPNRCYMNTSAYNPQYYSMLPMYSNTTDINFDTLMPDFLLSNDFDWYCSTSKVSNILKKGVHMAVYRGHGDPFCWQQPYYSVNHIKEDTYSILNISSNRTFDYLHPIIFSVTCSTGNFTEPECFASAALDQKFGGGAAVIASSADSYSGFNDAMILGFFDTFYPDSVLSTYITTDSRFFSKKTKLRMGQILDTGMYRMAEKYLSPDSIYYSYDEEREIWNGSNMFYIAGEYELFHCFGDPSMMMRTEKPTPFSNASVEIDPQTNRCTVLTGEGPAYISFYDKNNEKIECFYGESAEFQFSNIHYANSTQNNNLIGYENVVISGPNKIPYIVNEWKKSVNEAFGDMVINGSNLHVEYTLAPGSVAYVLVSSASTGIVLLSECDYRIGYTDIDLSTLSSGPIIVTLILNNEIITSETYQYLKN